MGRPVQSKKPRATTDSAKWGFWAARSPLGVSMRGYLFLGLRQGALAWCPLGFHQDVLLGFIEASWFTRVFLYGRGVGGGAYIKDPIISGWGGGGALFSDLLKAWQKPSRGAQACLVKWPLNETLTPGVFHSKP